MLTVGSLFSGIGGLELGLEMAGLGPVLWQVEREPFPRCVLRHHWPEAELYDDVCTVGAANLAPVDLICGGFPCQDVSSAGKGAGLAGERSGLWREFARVVGEVRPGWVVVENVASGAGRWLDAVVRELEQLGYACLPLPVAARDVGAPHRRERLFIVAHRDGARELQPERRELGIGGRAANGAPADVDGPVLRVREQREPRGRASAIRDEGSAVAGEHREGRLAADAPELRRGQGWIHVRARESDAARDLAAAPDPRLTRREGPGPGEQVEGRPRPTPHAGWSLESGLVPLVHGLSGGLAGRRRRARIRALGNAVVPQCSEVVGWVIRELLEA